MLDLNHEKSLENSFLNNFRETARTKNITCVCPSLDSQDRIVGADYLFTDSARYAIIEFKYKHSGLKTEANKNLRKKLCITLTSDEHHLMVHKECHFLAYSNAPKDYGIIVNKYFNAICNQKIWGEEYNGMKYPNTEFEATEDVFIDDFFTGIIGADFDTFLDYLIWLLNLSDESNTTGHLELLISNPLDHRAAKLPFTNVEALHNWLINNAPNLQHDDDDDDEYKPSYSDSFSP